LGSAMNFWVAGEADDSVPLRPFASRWWGAGAVATADLAVGLPAALRSRFAPGQTQRSARTGCGGRLGGAVLGGTPRRSGSGSL